MSFTLVVERVMVLRTMIVEFVYYRNVSRAITRMTSTYPSHIRGSGGFCLDER